MIMLSNQYNDNFLEFIGLPDNILVNNDIKPSTTKNPLKNE